MDVRRLSLLKSPFSLRQLMLRPTVDTFLRHDLGAAIAPLDPANATRSRAALHLEILAVRHQLAVLQRSRPRRVRLAKTDRWLWVLLSRLWTGWRTRSSSSSPTPPSHGTDAVFNCGGPGRVGVASGDRLCPANIRTLIREMAEANPRWAAARMHGELLKLGVDVCQRPTRCERDSTRQKLQASMHSYNGGPPGTEPDSTLVRACPFVSVGRGFRGTVIGDTSLTRRDPV
jgi:hypothetical protein